MKKSRQARCWGVQGGASSPLVEAPEAPDLERRDKGKARKVKPQGRH
jgi:hypothetical protein